MADRVQLVLCFTEEARPSLSGGRFVSTSGADLEPLQRWLERCPRRRVAPLFLLQGRSASASERAAGLDRFFVVTTEMDEEEARRSLDELQNMDVIEEAYIEETTEPASE